MRWLVVLLFAGAGVALGAAGLLLLRDDGPGELLPDLDQALPSKLEIVEEGDTYRLVFASAVDNVGTGPLLLEGARPDRATAAMAVRQLVRRTDGSSRSRTVPGELTYATSETHEHWHLQGFETYELLRAPEATASGRTGRPASASETATRPRRATWSTGSPTGRSGRTSAAATNPASCSCARASRRATGTTTNRSSKASTWT